MATNTKKKVIVKKSKPAPYRASIKIFGKIYSSEGETVLAAIENLKPLGTPRGMSILTIEKEGAKKDRILPANQTFRLFSLSRFTREIALKNTSLLFGNL